MARKLRVASRRKKNGGAPMAGSGEMTKLSAFADLEVPVRPLLSIAEERRIGGRITGCLRRLAALVPLHPEGYRRYLARLEDVVTGGAPVFSWFPLSQRMEADLALATRAIRKAESLVDSTPVRALKAYQEGVDTLRRYPLAPEVLHQWAREVGGKLPSSRGIGKSKRLQKVDRLVRKITRILDRERDLLVVPNFRLVLKEVFRYRPVGMKRSDLFQEGIIGLHKAVFRFDSTRGIRFSTYATFWIRQAMRKCLTDKARLIRVPQAVQEELRKAKNSYEPAEADRIRRILSGTVLFSHGESDDSKDRFSFDIKDPSTPELGESLRMRRMPEAVQDALMRLDSRQRAVVQRRFGLAGERPQTLEEIGVHLNLSRERIRQIEQEALAMMRRSQGLQEVYEDLGQAVVTAADTHN